MGLIKIKPTAYIFDVDGTLADVDPYLHLIRGSNKDYDDFHKASIDALPNIEVVQMLNNAVSDRHAILIVTSRKEKYRGLTSMWLAKNNIRSHALFMRSDDDHRPDYEAKKDMLDKITEHWDVLHAVDDNPNVIKLWEDHGIPTTTVTSENPNIEITYNTKSKYLIVSYPRSGSNYFQLAWKEKNHEYIRCIRSSEMIKTITEDSSLKIIGLIRNPIDSITSRILINKTHEQPYQKDEAAIDFALSEYIEVYNFIIDRADFVIDLSNFDQIDKIIETILNSEPTFVNQDKIKNSLDNIKDYSPSFIGHVDYEKFKDIIKNHDLKTQNKLYNLAYQKRLMI